MIGLFLFVINLIDKFSKKPCGCFMETVKGLSTFSCIYIPPSLFFTFFTLLSLNAINTIFKNVETYNINYDDLSGFRFIEKISTPFLYFSILIILLLIAFLIICNCVKGSRSEGDNNNNYNSLLITPK